MIGKSEDLFNYYQKIYSLLTPYYRCQLYNESERINLNILQADKEGCPFKIILGKEELEKGEITLVRRDNVERKITVSLESSETEKSFLHNFENNLAENLEKYNLESKSQERLNDEHNEIVNSARKGLKKDKIIKVIKQEIVGFQKNLYQKSADFRDSHIFPVNNFSELEKKIKEGKKGLFLVPFCNNLECEESIKKKVPAYSIRCVTMGKVILTSKCLFCSSVAQNKVYLGRSY